MKRVTGLLALVALLVVSRAHADTLVSGTIGTNTTWTLVNTPYVVTSTVTVVGGTNPVLTIQAGVMVKFNAGSALVITSQGGLQAVGASGTGNQITFTANGSSTPGFWRGIQIQGNGAPSQISYATISYGGGSSLGGLDLQASNATIQNVTAQSNAVAGINTQYGSPSLVSCSALSNPVGLVIGKTGQPSLQGMTLTGNTGYAMKIDPAVTLGTVSAATATSNGTNAALFSASNVDVTTTWKYLAIPYVATATINVGAAAAPVLTIQAGITVQFATATQLRVGFTFNQAPGALQAAGTSGSPITLTSVGAVSPGAWGGVSFYPTSTPASSMTYTTVSGGGGVALTAGILIDGVSPALSNVTAQTNALAGISLLGTAAPTISNSTLSSNPVGLLVATPATATLLNVSLLNNTSFAASLDCGVTLASAAGVTATGNLFNAVEIRTGVVGTSTTWAALGTIPYIVTGSVSVYRAAGPVATLTLPAGVTVRFRSNTSLGISNGGFAALQAVGTSLLPITLTADGTPSPGFWRGLSFNSAATGTLAYVSVIGAGNTGGAGAIEIDNASPSMDHMTVTTSAFAGINVAGGSPTLSNSAVSGAPWGIKLTTCTTPSITATSVTGNTTGGVWVGPPCNPLLQALSITGNTGYALSLDVNVTMGSGSSVTATGNGTNAIEDAIGYGRPEHHLAQRWAPVHVHRLGKCRRRRNACPDNRGGRNR